MLGLLLKCDCLAFRETFYDSAGTSFQKKAKSSLSLQKTDQLELCSYSICIMHCWTEEVEGERGAEADDEADSQVEQQKEKGVTFSLYPVAKKHKEHHNDIEVAPNVLACKIKPHKATLTQSVEGEALFLPQFGINKGLKQ
jgi:hypothetical protein